MKFSLGKTLKYWLPAAFVAFVFAGSLYLSVQQSLRQSANDPQIQMAEDAAAALGSGAAVDDIIPTQSVDIASSLAPYIVVFAPSGNPIAGSGMLNGSLPELPSGVFSYVKNSGEDRITWQSASGVRSAIVVVPVNGGQGGFVMAGRSLREVEKREEQTEYSVGAALIIALAGSLILSAIAASL